MVLYKYDYDCYYSYTLCPNRRWTPKYVSIIVHFACKYRQANFEMSQEELSCDFRERTTT